MSRSIRLLVGLVLACVVGLAGGAIQPAAAAPVDDPAQGLALTSVCPVAEGASKDVSAVHPAGGLFGPYFLYALDAKGTLTTFAVLFPYQVTFSGEGLKSRHVTPDLTYTRPGRAPANRIECTFNGKNADGAVQAVVSGTVLVLKPRR